MKKALIITYYWPPAGGPGVQRWLKFATYLKEFGIEPVIYVPENPSYPITDQTLIDEIPENIEILKKPILEPYGLAKFFSKNNTETISSGIIPDEKKQGKLQQLMLYIRGNFFIPDARKFWIKPSVKYLKKYLSQNTVDVIITTGPPHSLHLIGQALKAETNLPWIADFRDPWTTIGYHDKLKLTKKSEKRHKDLEKQILNRADHILTTSSKTKSDFEKITTKSVTCITNGYDKPGDYSIKQDDEFSLSHIGSLLESRNPYLLWQALAELNNENAEFKKHLKIKLAGKVSNRVLRTIRENGLEAHLELLGYVSHKEALKLQRKTQVLLLIEIDSPETRAIIPGKVFEYLAARRPVLAMGPEGASFFEIIKKNEAGSCFLYNEKARLKEQILKWFLQYKQGGLPDISSSIEQYSRKSLTQKLSGIIFNVLEQTR